MLARNRRHSGSLTRAAFLSARNDAYANVAIMGARLVTAMHSSIWPDVIVGVGIAFMNVDAAREVWTPREMNTWNRIRDVSCEDCGS
jgi:Co/Zn/Cd efflux system component